MTYQPLLLKSMLKTGLLSLGIFLFMACQSKDSSSSSSTESESDAILGCAAPASETVTVDEYTVFFTKNKEPQYWGVFNLDSKTMEVTLENFATEDTAKTQTPVTIDAAGAFSWTLTLGKETVAAKGMLDTQNGSISGTYTAGDAQGSFFGHSLLAPKEKTKFDGEYEVGLFLTSGDAKILATGSNVNIKNGNFTVQFSTILDDLNFFPGNQTVIVGGSITRQGSVLLTEVQGETASRVFVNAAIDCEKKIHGVYYIFGKTKTLKGSVEGHLLDPLAPAPF